MEDTLDRHTPEIITFCQELLAREPRIAAKIAACTENQVCLITDNAWDIPHDYREGLRERGEVLVLTDMEAEVVRRALYRHVGCVDEGNAHSAAIGEAYWVMRLIHPMWKEK